MRRIVLALVLCLLPPAVLGCGASTSGGSSASTAAETATTAGETATTTAEPPAHVVRVYFLRDGKVEPVGRDAGSTQALARAALDALLAGPTEAERAAGLTTDVPAATSVRGVTIADGRATVDFDGSFAHGAEATITPRLMQVVFTLTQFPSVESVSFELDGQPFTGVTDGYGAILHAPATRADYEALTPLILVESPLPGDPVTDPLRIRGSANTFEATFQAEVVNEAGDVLGKQTVTATSGSGERGTFSAEVPVHGLTGAATLVVYEDSAATGKRVHIERIPLGHAG